MPLAGRYLSIKWALALGYFTGWRANHLVLSVAVMTAESGRYVGAWHENADGSMDRGLFQINSIHASLSEEDAFKAIPNAAFAYQLSQEGRDWTPWAAYNNGAYSQFVEEIDGMLATAKAGTWNRSLADRVAAVPTELA